MAKTSMSTSPAVVDGPWIVVSGTVSSIMLAC